ncbi:MAG: DUF2075 domain-containing protein [Dehalococcoidia bacterium]|nr:DUF2075 domain-containing protein [Dehalococcoidia bacterium]
MRAWHRGTLAELVEHDTRAVAAELAAAATDSNRNPTAQSVGAWEGSVGLLKEAASALIDREPQALDWHYLLEYDIPRRGRLIDAVILANDVIFVLEWKEAARFARSAYWQVEQYALDLRDFHKESSGRFIVPVLIATDADSPFRGEASREERAVQEVQNVVPSGLPDLILEWWSALHVDNSVPIDPVLWENSAYKPTLSIIEAARALFEGHQLTEISVSGATNLDETVQAVQELIEKCRRDGRRGIAFVTGAPGSGKTLAGLQIAHLKDSERDVAGEGAVFLSGNRPLVEVISETLARSAAEVKGTTKDGAKREIQALIDHAYRFRDLHAPSDGPVAPEHVILFDEAQRAWDAERVTTKTKRKKVLVRSEPDLFLSIMNRVSRWGVIVALVGNGQEIGDGEAGLPEWGRALAEEHPDWLVYASPAVLPGATPPPGGLLYASATEASRVITDPRLHLQMNLRSPRAELLNTWVDRLLEPNAAVARVALTLREYPLVMTRHLDHAKAWLREIAGEQRYGLLASSEARRLRAWGIDTRVLWRESAWSHWFLAGQGDIRSSNQLEVAATNFDCQGLEIDWACVCWGNDLVPTVDLKGWEVQSLHGADWVEPNDRKRQYIINGYRVILTRARRGQVIWVPKPDGSDSTLPPEDFDRVAALLEAAGVPSLE